MSDRNDLLDALIWALPHVRWMADTGSAFCCKFCKSSSVGNMGHPIKHADDCPYVRACNVMQKAPRRRHEDAP